MRFFFPVILPHAEFLTSVFYDFLNFFRLKKDLKKSNGSKELMQGTEERRVYILRQKPNWKENNDFHN